MQAASLPVFVALLRAANVGGTGLLPMAALRDICTGCGLRKVRTYIQSGNAIFETAGGEDETAARLEQALARALGKPVAVMIRAAPELRTTLERNPFPKAEPARVGVVFLPCAPPPDFLAGVRTPAQEELYASQRELFIHYPEGMGRSKLKLPQVAAAGTMRNLNTVAKLVALAES